MNASRKSKTVYVSLGSNIDPEKNILAAISWLKNNFSLIAHSTAWHSPAVGTKGPDYLNAAAQIATQLSGDDLKLIYFRPYETQAGRVRTANKNAPRPIDLDILIYDNAIWDDGLWKTAHLAAPLAEIYPDLPGPDGRPLSIIVDEDQLASPLTPHPEILSKTVYPPSN